MSEYAHCILLLHYAGKPINEENVAKILQAAGIEPDQAKIKAFVQSLEGKNIEEILKQATLALPAEEKKEEEKEVKEEEKEEKKAEEAAAGLSALFG